MNIHKKCKKYKEQIDYIYPSQRRIIAIGDLHGDIDALKAILINSKLIKNDSDNPVWTGNDTFLLSVGDTVKIMARIDTNDGSGGELQHGTYKNTFWGYNIA